MTPETTFQRNMSQQLLLLHQRVYIVMVTSLQCQESQNDI